MNRNLPEKPANWKRRVFLRDLAYALAQPYMALRVSHVAAVQEAASGGNAFEEPETSTKRNKTNVPEQFK